METTVEDRRSPRGAEKRKEIVSAAAELFLVNGYGRTSMDQVHACIGGSKRTLYNHFPSKEALFEAIITEYMFERVWAAFEPLREETDLRAALLKVGTAYLRIMLSSEGLALYRIMVSEAAHFPDLSRKVYENGPTRGTRDLADFFREQQAQGMIEVGDPQVAAGQFLGSIRGDIHLAAVFGMRVPSPELVDATLKQAVDRFVRGTAPLPDCTSVQRDG